MFTVILCTLRTLISVWHSVWCSSVARKLKTSANCTDAIAEANNHNTKETKDPHGVSSVGLLAANILRPFKCYSRPPDSSAAGEQTFRLVWELTCSLPPSQAPSELNPLRTAIPSTPSAPKWPPPCQFFDWNSVRNSHLHACLMSHASNSL